MSGNATRWLAAAALVTVLALVHVLLLHPAFVEPLRGIEGEISQLREREARIQAQLQHAPGVARQLKDLQAGLAARPGLMAEASPELATAALVHGLERAVRSASPGGRSCALRERSPLPATSVDGFVEVAVQARLRCGVDELAAILHVLEGSSPRLFIDGLSVQASRQRGGSAESGLGLDTSFRLVGYLAPAAPTGDADER
ncbi:type II secretion system protein GspM [Pseudoxanthomonas koreensis]|uniref:type II secretion system protein GspM n=1 Tax=Pseudoxanthomonas koreensis TaxID=266061 RepID=UPI0035A65297